MRVLRDVSLKQKLMVIIMLTSSAALLLACAAFILYELTEFRKDIVDDLTAKAEFIGSQSTAALKFTDPKAGKEILDKLKTAKHVVAASIYSRDGKVLAKYQRPDVKGDFSPPYAQYNAHSFKDDFVELFREIFDDDRRDVGAVYLKSDLLELNARLKQY